MVDLPFRMTLSDLEWFSEMFNDTKQRSVSLRQLSFLYYVRWTVNQVRNFGVCLSYYGFDTLPDLNYELTTALTVLLRICDGVRRKTLILGWFLCLYQTRLACGGVIFSTCPFLRSSICVFVRHQTCEHDFFEKWTGFDANWHKWSMGKDRKRSTLGFRGSTVNVTQGEDLWWHHSQPFWFE